MSRGVQWLVLVLVLVLALALLLVLVLVLVVLVLVQPHLQGECKLKLGVEQTGRRDRDLVRPVRGGVVHCYLLYLYLYLYLSVSHCVTASGLSYLSVRLLLCILTAMTSEVMSGSSSLWMAMRARVREQRRGMQFGGVRSTSHVANSFIGTGVPGNRPCGWEGESFGTMRVTL
jgi:hypothetical protein